MPKNAWIEEVYRMMDSRAYGSTELVAELKEMPRYRRYTPSPQEIVNVMRGDARFRFIGTMTVGSLLRLRSHEIKVFGRCDREYGDVHPFRTR